MPKRTEQHNLAVKNPSLAEQWHPTKNGTLTPQDVTPSSGKYVWWTCSKGHEWVANITHRNHGGGCPYCSRKRVSDDTCLQTINPELSKEWHPAKNGTRTPRDVAPFSRKKVWWICSKGHEWEATVSNRHKGTGCPYCTGQAVNNENSLQTINPNLSSQWHPTRNCSLTPAGVTANSGRKAWWTCDKGHEWQAIIANRNRGRGCPYCAGKKDPGRA